jgi:hypothetical protein
MASPRHLWSVEYAVGQSSQGGKLRFRMVAAMVWVERGAARGEEGRGGMHYIESVFGFDVSARGFIHGLISPGCCVVFCLIKGGTMPY